jgi:hypothetical protein
MLFDPEVGKLRCCLENVLEVDKKGEAMKG